MGDWIFELASLAKVTKGRAPIQLVWTRDDDLRGGFYRPMALHHVEAGVVWPGRGAGWGPRSLRPSLFPKNPFWLEFPHNGIAAHTPAALRHSPSPMSRSP